MAIDNLDETIGNVERLYRSITGHEPPVGSGSPYAAIPPEQDPSVYVDQQLNRLIALLAEVPLTRPVGSVAGAGGAVTAVTPPLTVWESPQEVVLFVDVPGVPKEAIALNVSGNTLSISAERPVTMVAGEGGASAGQMTWAELPTGSLRRAVPLPPGLVTDQLVARLNHGVLEIRIPRVPTPTSPRTVKIQ